MKRFIRAPYFILMFIVLAGVMVTSALVEFTQSKKELYALMSENAEATLDAIARSAAINLESNQIFEEELSFRLLSNARMVGRLYDRLPLRQDRIDEIAEETRLAQLLITNYRGKIQLRSANAILPTHDVWQSFLESDLSETVFGFQPGEFSQIEYYSVAVKTRKGNIVLASINSDEIIRFRTTIGFGKLLSEIANNKYIVYLALQDTNSILVATQNIEGLNSISTDPFLNQAMLEGKNASREFKWRNQTVYEIVRPFYYKNHVVGIYRLGLSLSGIQALNARTLQRIFVIFTVLILVGCLLFVLLSIRHKYEVIDKQYNFVQTYYGKILQNITDGVISFTSKSKISMINKAARNLLALNGRDYINDDISKLPPEIFPPNGDNNLQSRELVLNGAQPAKTISVDTSVIREDDGEISTTIYVLRDLTEKRKLEEQIKQREKLASMGRMAAGVAHEVRNPLNAISTIVQQFALDFQPKKNGDEYNQLTKLLINEVRRLNGIVTQFVNFSKPAKLKLTAFSASELLQEIKRLTENEAAGKGAAIKTNFANLGTVFWDEDQIKQCLFNLTKNAVQAIDQGGQVSLNAENVSGKIKIEIVDNGVGISEKNFNKIYELYYTTKPSGTGLGLSIVHRIITEHGGTISVESKPHQGAKFVIELPKWVNV